MHQNERRRVDWRVTVSDDLPRLKLVTAPLQSSELASLTSEVLANPSPEVVDRLLRCAVEFARQVIGLERVGIFLFDTQEKLMVGTWGTSATGTTVDEHDIQYDFGEMDRAVFSRAELGYPWSVFEDCPMFAQENGQTRILGRGWIASTAIVGKSQPLGVLYNDTAISRDALDEVKQARVAVLCSLLGHALEPSLVAPVRIGSKEAKTQHRLVREVTQLLVRDPTMSCDAMAKRLKISAGQLSRTFKRHARTSIIDHRNEIRLARFLGRVDLQAGNLFEAALDAGFGSYAQFHRVFRARFGQSPREYLLEHPSQPGGLAPSDERT
jgi:AraC-like DNA-binding protein